MRNTSRYLMYGVVIVLTGLNLFSADVLDSSSVLPKVSGTNLIDCTNASIRWYHDVQLSTQYVSQPSELYYYNTEHDLSTKILQTTFASISAQVYFVENNLKLSSKNITSSSDAERINQFTAQRAANIEQVRQQIKACDTAIRAELNLDVRATLLSRRSALQAQLLFLEKLRDTLQKTGGLLKIPGEALDTTTLAGQLEGLHQSIADELSTNNSSSSIDVTSIKDLDTGGLYARAESLFSIAKDIRGVDGLIKSTAQLQGDLLKYEEPLRASLRNVVQRGDELREIIQKSDLKQAVDAQHEIEKLSGNFEKIWASLQPLQEANLLIERSKHNLQQWHDSLLHHEADLARALLVKVITLFLIIVFVLLLSELWRRVTFKYVHDDRRRRQFLFLRRFVTWILLTIIIITGLVSNLSSLAATTGLLTVAIALALQTIILSVAAYFFVIGKHGLKVGDRITAGTAMGEIIDIGLVRLYIKELVGTGSELRATGRIITFPNSIIFQPVPLYKQMASSSLGWRQIMVKTKPGTLTIVKDKMLSAVQAAFSGYQSLIEPHSLKSDSLLGLKIDAASPYVVTQVNGTNEQVSVIYPVSSLHSNHIDKLVAQAVQAALVKEEVFRNSIDGDPCVSNYFDS